MPRARPLLEPPSPSSVSRRALLLAAAPAALLLAPMATAVAASEVAPTPAAAPTPICACGAPQGPMRVIGWAARRHV